MLYYLCSLIIVKLYVRTGFIAYFWVWLFQYYYLKMFSCFVTKPFKMFDDDKEIKYVQEKVSTDIDQYHEVVLTPSVLRFS